MALKSDIRQQLIDERVRALAIMHLTRRDDLVIQEASEDNGLDLLVHFPPENKEGLRLLGVKHQGRWESGSRNHTKQVVRPILNTMRRKGLFPFPVCLFLFTMEKDEAWYTWVAEPVIKPDGRPHLQVHDQAYCLPLDKTALDGIIEAVDQWYGAFFGTVIIEGHEQASRKKRHANV